MIDDVPMCVDCKHCEHTKYTENQQPFDRYVCLIEVPDVIDGETKPAQLSCGIQRYKGGPCGYEGKYFEEAE